VNLEVASAKSPFFVGIERMYLPIAHAEGMFVPRDERRSPRWRQTAKLVLRYARTTTRTDYRKRAGLCDETGRVCGLMPHRSVTFDSTQTRAGHANRAPAAGVGLRCVPERGAGNFV